jgi:hypothetical protein
MPPEGFDRWGVSVAPIVQDISEIAPSAAAAHRYKWPAVATYYLKPISRRQFGASERGGFDTGSDRPGRIVLQTLLEAENPIMQFSLYLTRKGIISAEQFVAALEVQQKQLVRIGQLAIEEGVLSPRQVFHILRSQSNSPHERFGDVAVGLDLMTHDQLRQLLMLQLDRQLPLVDILIHQNAISSLQATQELAAFRREMEGRDQVVKQPIQVKPRRSFAALLRAASPDAQYASGI